jgi:3-oxoacyl-[acyl-carrier-protein] synthase-3
MARIRSIISATGSSIPALSVSNEEFMQHRFLGTDRAPIDKPNEEIVRQFEAITGIHHRRYISDEQVCSDLATEAARNALDSSGIDGETLDGIIVAHNFGDIRMSNRRSDMVPALAARVKQKLGIRNPRSASWDLIFGCPGWLQGVIQADYMIRSGDAKRVMVIGAETLSPVCDPHDRDSLIYADGAGATIVEAREGDDDVGILAHTVRTDALEYASMLHLGSSYNTDVPGHELYLKMQGRKLYRYAVQTVPAAIKECIDKARKSITDVAKILIHQANEKMDDAIVAALYGLYGQEVPAGVMPMTISWLGNSSVATIPTLLDLILRGEVPDQRLGSGDTVVFASVGAGMNVNAFVYTMP